MSSLMKAYHAQVFGHGFWERRSWKDFSSKCWVSSAQKSGPAEGTKILRECSKTSGVGKAAMVLRCTKSNDVISSIQMLYQVFR